MRKIIYVLVVNIKLVVKWVLGNKIKWNIKNMISLRAELNTYGSGEIQFGYKAHVKPNTEVTARNGKIKIGESCFVNRNCMIVSHESICIGDYTTIGPNTCIYDHDHNGNGGFVTAPIIIGKNVWIGAGCIILKGVTIGDGAVVGAGTVVLKDIESNDIVFDERNKRVISKGE